MNNNDLNKVDPIRVHAWSYFQYHAQQRIILFKFFIGLVTFTSAGAVLFLKNYPSCGNVDEWCGLVLGIVLFIITFVFHRLDLRNRHLIKYAEVSLRKYEEKYYK